MSKFNIGDLVYLPVSENSVWCGEGEVVEIDVYGSVNPSISIRFTTGKRADNIGGFYENRVVLLKSGPKFDYALSVEPQLYDNVESLEIAKERLMKAGFTAKVEKKPYLI